MVNAEYPRIPFRGGSKERLVPNRNFTSIGDSIVAGVLGLRHAL